MKKQGVVYGILLSLKSLIFNEVINEALMQSLIIIHIKNKKGIKINVCITEAKHLSVQKPQLWCGSTD